MLNVKVKWIVCFKDEKKVKSEFCSLKCKNSYFNQVKDIQNLNNSSSFSSQNSNLCKNCNSLPKFQNYDFCGKTCGVEYQKNNSSFSLKTGQYRKGGRYNNQRGNYTNQGRNHSIKETIPAKEEIIITKETIPAKEEIIIKETEPAKEEIITKGIMVFEDDIKHF